MTSDYAWRETLKVVDVDVLALNLDVYDTKEGLWNPEHGPLEEPSGWEFLPTGDAFVPYAVGYVELAGEVKVETRLTGADGLRVGMEMELVVVPFRADERGNEVVTFAFRPVR